LFRTAGNGTDDAYCDKEQQSKAEYDAQAGRKEHFKEVAHSEISVFNTF
jgi:hypothetical protein